MAAGILGTVLATPAAAATANNESVQLELTGSVQPRCGFSETPGSKELGSMAPGTAIELGTLGFRCNLPGSPSVNLSVESENGGLLREGGGELVSYQLAWALPGRGSFVDAGQLKNRQDFTETAGDINSGRRGAFKVLVTGAGEMVAGVYRDRITYTISP